jgi:hypothetical protein
MNILLDRRFETEMQFFVHLILEAHCPEKLADTQSELR